MNENTPINRITETDVIEFDANPTLDRYQEVATKSAIYPGQETPLGLLYVALKGAGEAGEFAEHVGKAMRDDGYMNTRDFLLPERRDKLIKEIGDQLWYLAAKCRELEFTLSEAAHLNLLKLKDRTDRNKLQGSGDER